MVFHKHKKKVLGQNTKTVLLFKIKYKVRVNWNYCYQRKPNRGTLDNIIEI